MPDLSVRRVVRVGALGLGALCMLGAVTGCGGGGGAAVHPTAPAAITVTSADFQQDGVIPVRFTCAGDGTVPALAWSGVPADTGWLALVVDDPSAPGGTYHHWYVVQIPPAVKGVAEGGAPQGRTVVGWKAPCPPTHTTDTYEFTVYALPKGYAPTKLGAVPVYDVDGLAAHALGEGTLSATATGS
ncbi:YbhB/YbcL family Raf kinase inhibitor-like protein [Streptacidiphilus cavernicola]|uniref:YbhB/YbcL family Raf kinase inhibitor-like protein n=1 Tax=Streptacidiphilus cavernicola TaxID=3342716 RepID=A0ABV6W4J3_9ACTN